MSSSAVGRARMHFKFLSERYHSDCQSIVQWTERSRNHYFSHARDKIFTWEEQTWSGVIQQMRLRAGNHVIELKVK